MAALCNFSREMQDSIRDVLDRQVKLHIRRLVRQELRSEKVENRILAFSSCRLFVLAARVPCKVELSFHYLDIQSIESKMLNQLILTVDGKSYTFNTLETDTDEVNHMITHIGTSVKQIYASFPLERIIKTIQVQPSDRLKTMHEMIRDIGAKPAGPCGGYTMMYACMCDYHGLPYRDEVAWDVDTIYLSQDSRELCLQDFDHLNGRDLVPIISALEHNPWFTKLNASNVKLTPEAAVEILRVMKRNAVLEELCLSGTGVNSDFIQKLATAILSNSGSQISRIDLSSNPIEDRGAIHFIGATSSLGHGLVHLDVSRTKLSGKGLNKLIDTLSQSHHVSSTLTSLNLSDNPSKGEDLQNLYNFLAQPNAITHLNLSGTDCALDQLFGAMFRGSCSCITSLKLSRNTYSHKKMKDVIVQPSWRRFFSSAVVLEILDLSNNKLPPEALKDLLLGISSNRQITNLHLDISGNDLQTQGAHKLESCIANIKQVTSLDISNNGFDQDISSLAGWITQNRSIKHLAIGRNFSTIKPKHLSNVLDSIVQLIQDDDSTIESLSLADSKLKGSVAVVVNALGSNISLTEIDLSGNNMGDFGARMLSKALQINSHLRTIYLDKNGLTAQGFEDIADAMEKNYILKKMPTPVNDAAAALRTQQERTERALQRIEALLQRNHSPQKFASDQAYRLQQGFLISSTQQMVDRLVVQIQDNMNALSMGGTEGFQSDIQSAHDIVKDADNSKQLLPQLQEIAMKSMDAGNPVDIQLHELSEELKQVLERHMKRTVTDMIECTKQQCAAIMAERVFVSDLEKGCVDKSTLPKDFTKHILDGIDVDIYNKVSELNLAVAAHISDRAIDEVITTLSQSHKTLTNHLNKKKQEERDQVPSLRIKGTFGPGDSPKLISKKKSLYGRKLRPQSAVDSDEVRLARKVYSTGEEAPTNGLQDSEKSENLDADKKLLAVIDECHDVDNPCESQSKPSEGSPKRLNSAGDDGTTENHVKPKLEVKGSFLMEKSHANTCNHQPTAVTRLKPKPAERSPHLSHRLKTSSCDGNKLKMRSISRSPNRSPFMDRKKHQQIKNTDVHSPPLSRRHVQLEDVKMAYKLYSTPKSTQLRSELPMQSLDSSYISTDSGDSLTGQSQPAVRTSLLSCSSQTVSHKQELALPISEFLEKSPLFRRKKHLIEQDSSVGNQLQAKNSAELAGQLPGTQSLIYESHKHGNNKESDLHSREQKQEAHLQSEDVKSNHESNICSRSPLTPQIMSEHVGHHMHCHEACDDVQRREPQYASVRHGLLHTHHGNQFESKMTNKPPFTRRRLPVQTKAEDKPIAMVIQVNVVDMDLPQLPSKIANDKLDEAEIIESLDDVANLQHVQKLNHIVKDRPKRTRSHAPRRPMTRQTKLLEDNLEPDEGLDKFFNSSPVTENAEVLPIKNKDKDNKSDTSSSGTGSARSTPESKKKAGWLKGLGGKDKEKKQTSGLFSRNKGSKTSDDKIKRISEVDENKSNNGVTNGPVDTVTKDVLHKQESLETTPTQTPTTTSPKATPSGTPIEQKKLETATSSQIPSSTQAPAQISTPVSPTSVSPATPTSGTLASPTSGTPALPDNGTPASPSSGAPHSEQKSIDDTSEETNVKTETAETKEEKKSDEPAKVHRQPIGVHKIGLGGNMLAEMKAKQEKRLTTQSKVVKMSNISKLDSHNEEKAETTAAELTDSKKSLSNDNQSLQSSTPVEELKTERDKHPDAQVNGDGKSSPELNNNVKVKTSGLDLSVMVKTGQKAPPPMKPRPPPVALKPGNKSGDADDLSSEDNSEANEQEDSTAKLSEEVGYANFIPVSENVKENKNLFVKDSGIAPMREKKQGGSVQSVRDRIKSMELGKDEPKKDDTKKAFSLPRGINPGGPVKTERPSSMTTSTLSDLKTQLRTPLATSTPALNTFEDDKTIYENLLADLDDTEIYENLKIQKDDNDLEHESKKKDKMNNVDKSDADKVPPVGPPDEIIMV